MIDPTIKKYLGLSRPGRAFVLLAMLVAMPAFVIVEATREAWAGGRIAARECYFTFKDMWYASDRHR